MVGLFALWNSLRELLRELLGELLGELLVIAQLRRRVVMIAMRFMFIGFDEYLAYLFFCELHRDVHVMTDGIFAVINDIALNSAQYTMLEMEALFGQGMFQSLKRVVFQTVNDT